MHLSLDAVRTLAAIVDAGTFEAASRALRVTPSAVSQRVRSLEQQVGRVLLIRSKPIRATEAGAALVRLARQLALVEHDAMHELGLEERTSTALPLAVNADSLATWFLPAVAGVVERHRLELRLHRDDQSLTTALLESGSVMAAITSTPEPVAGCISRPLGAMRYVAVSSPGFRDLHVAGRPRGQWMQDAPVVHFDRHDEVQRDHVRSYGVDPSAPPFHVVPSSNDFARAIELGLGWGMLPEAQSAPLLSRGAVVTLGGEPIDVPLHWQRWAIDSPIITAVEDAIVSAARRELRPLLP